ncbi:MAG: hypothetical protein C0467_23475 [Planctomycetaceae bacterium]|nr:hypothetical protein [Planctomycetaceae bacterium]
MSDHAKLLQDARPPRDKAVSILDHTREGCGTRAIGRLLVVETDADDIEVAKKRIGISEG